MNAEQLLSEFPGDGGKESVAWFLKNAETLRLALEVAVRCCQTSTEWIWSGEALEVSEAHGWKITRQRLHAVATSGYITHEVVGGRLRFDKQSVIAWAENPDLRRSGRKNHRDEQND